MSRRRSRRQRRSHYGRPIELPQLPVSKNSGTITPYGAKKFRTGGGFVGEQGSAMPAYVLDIDGTLQTYGQGVDKKALAWVNAIHKANPDVVFLVVTARDHGSFGYDSSFDWLMHNFPHPFIGPFARGKDDPRYASEFKRELAQGFEDMGLYQIMGAADDNGYVIDMWKQWAIDHFEDPEDFSLLECSYGGYDGWRSSLSSKSRSYYPSTYTAPAKTSTVYDPVVNAPKHRPAGVQNWVKNDANPSPEGGAVNVSNDPRWAGYFAKRERDGAYLGDAVREVLYTNITDRFAARFTDADLDLLTDAELESLVEMTADEAESFVDSAWDEMHLAENPSPARETLEADVYASYGDLTWAEIVLKSDAELELLMKADEATSPITQPLPVQEVLEA